MAAYVRACTPPLECPASTYGPDSPAAVSRRCRSPAAWVESARLGESSLQPCPARSYTHTRVVRATVGVMRAHCGDVPLRPLSRTTVGLPVPLQLRCRRYRPTSTSLPGMAPAATSGAFVEAW